MAANKIRIRLKKGVPSYKTAGMPRMVTGKVYEVPRTYWDIVKHLVDVIPVGWHPVNKSSIKVLVPESLTSAVIIMSKLQDLCKQCHAGNIVLHVQERIGTPRRAVPMYRMMHQKIASMAYKMIPDLQVPSFGFLNDFHGYDYVLDPMATVREGGSLDEWLPRVKTDIDCVSKMLICPPKDIQSIPENTVFLLMRNEDVQAKEYGSWGVKEWAKIINLLAKDYEVRIVGMKCDKAYAEEVIASGANAKQWQIGRWSLRKVIASAKKGAGLISLRSGAAMLAAAQGIPTTIVWPTANKVPFQFRYDWLRKGDGRNYLAMDMIADLDEAVKQMKSNLRPING